MTKMILFTIVKNHRWIQKNEITGRKEISREREDDGVVLLVLREIPKSGFVKIMYSSTIDPIETWFDISSFEININTLSREHSLQYSIKKTDFNHLQHRWKISSTHQLYRWPTFHRHTIILFDQMYFIVIPNEILPLLEIPQMDYPIVSNIDYPTREDYPPFVMHSTLMLSIDPKKSSQFNSTFYSLTTHNGMISFSDRNKDIDIPSFKAFFASVLQEIPKI